jgi:hypothetical protein
MKNVQLQVVSDLQIWKRRARGNMGNLHKELKMAESEIKGHLELISIEMNAIETKLYVCTAIGSNSTTLPPPNSNA